MRTVRVEAPHAPRGGGGRRPPRRRPLAALGGSWSDRRHLRVERRDDEAVDERRRADRAAGLPLEPRRRDAKRRPGTGRTARCAAAPLRLGCSRCSSWSPAAPGSSVRTSRSGSLAAGDDVVVLDKLTYSGNPREPRGRRASSSCRATSPTPRRSRPRPPAATRSSTSPPRRTSTARSSARPTSCRTEFSARRCCSRRCARDRRPLRPGLDGRGLRRSRRRRLVDGGRRARAVEPVQRREGGGRPARPGVRPHLRRQRVDHARREHVRAEPVPGEAAAAVRHERARRRAAAGVRRRPAVPRVALRRRPLRRRSRSCCARARPARSTTSAARTSARTSRWCGTSSAHRRRRVARAPRRGSGRPRPPLLARRPQAPRARLAAGRSRSTDGLAETVEWYARNRGWWEPIKSGEYRAYYERQYAERLSRLAVSSSAPAARSASRLAAEAADLLALALELLGAREQPSTPSQRPSTSRVKAEVVARVGLVELARA